MRSFLILTDIMYIIEIDGNKKILEEVSNLLYPYISLSFHVEPEDKRELVREYKKIELSLRKVSVEYMQDAVNRIKLQIKSRKIFNYSCWMKQGDTYVIADDYSNSTIYKYNKSEYKICMEFFSDTLVTYDLSRFLRNLYVYSRSQKFDIFHGAALESNSCVSIFTGDKFSGKTTTLTYLLKTNSYQFISNDLILLGNGVCEGVGKAISLRQLTIDELEIDVSALKYPYNNPSENKFSKTKMTPNEYCSIVKSEISKPTNSRIGMCFYLEYTDSIVGNIRKVTSKGEIRRLVSNQTIVFDYEFPFDLDPQLRNIKDTYGWYKNTMFFFVKMPRENKEKILKEINVIIKEMSVND